MQKKSINVAVFLIAMLVFGGVAHAAQQRYCVEGRLMFLSTDGSTQPAPHVTAHIYDKDESPDEDDLLAVILTDATGRFRAEFEAEPYQDIYVRFVAANTQWKVANVSGKTYEWHTGVFWDEGREPQENCSVKIGTYVIGRDGRKPAEAFRQSVGALWIYDAARAANDFARKHGLKLGEKKQVQITWPVAEKSSYVINNRIFLCERHATQRDIILHEIGHVMMNASSRIPNGAGGKHRIDKAYNPQLAWAEGWATFFAACVMYGDGEKRPMLAHFGGGISIESLPASIAAGESNEMRVAAALWDLYDVVNESGDEIGVRFEDIWEVLAQSNGKPINGLRQFVAGLIRINFTDEAIIAKIHRTLAANGIVYDLDDMKQYVTAK